MYVEFLIAWIPVFGFFAALVQLCFLHLASLVVHHAAVVGARAAVVILPDDPAYYDGQQVNDASGARLDAIRTLIVKPLKAVARSPDDNLVVKFPTSPGGKDSQQHFAPHDRVRVRVEYTYACRVPIGRYLACGIGAKKVLVGEAALPNQGGNVSY